MATRHPLKQVLAGWSTGVDLAVLSHGFAKHGRDYVLIVQANGTFQLTLTHVPELSYETRVRDDVWPNSWDDVYTDYSAWKATGEPDGYVWGTDWSLAYPGIAPLYADASAERWAARLEKPMFAMKIETDRFLIKLIFHSALVRQVSDERVTIDQVLVPITRQAN